jgi:hypothetical protein
MTIAPPHSTSRQRVHEAQTARLEIAWTVSAEALDGRQSYASAVLHLECCWQHGHHHLETQARVECTAIIDRAGVITAVKIPDAAHISVDRHGRWTHIAITTDPGATFLTASFEQGRLAYCTSTAPALARLQGGAYDPPTGILELYDPQ